jgi:hypothetical protein
MWTLVLGLPAAVAVAILGRSAAWAYAALAVEIVLYAANALSALLLEASGSRGRRWSATGAVAQVAAVVGVGWLLVPVAGAVGGIAALIAGELARAGALLALTGPTARGQHRRGAVRPRSSNPPEAALTRPEQGAMERKGS